MYRLFYTLIVAATLFSASSVNAQVGIIHTIAGNDTAGYSGDGGPATAAKINSPWAIGCDSVGTVYIGDFAGHYLRKVSTGGIITTIAGNGTGGGTGDGGPSTNALVNFITGIVIDSVGNVIFSDYTVNRIRKITPAGFISNFAGTGSFGTGGDGGPASAVQFTNPGGLVFDKHGNLIVADIHNHTIRKISTTGTITTIAGTPGVSGFFGDGGPATAAKLFGPMGIGIDTAGNIFIADEQNNRIRKIDTGGIISTLTGDGSASYFGDGGPASAGKINEPDYVSCDRFGNVFIADNGNNVIRKVGPTGMITTYAGDHIGGWMGDGGPATAAELGGNTGICVDKVGNVYSADNGTNVIRKIIGPYTTLGAVLATLTGSDLSLYPNPNKGQFTIKGSLKSLEDENVSVEVTNVMGQVVYTRQTTAQKGTINVDISLGANLPAGFYQARLTTLNEGIVARFVVER